MIVLIMCLTLLALLLTGFPVAFVLPATGLGFAYAGYLMGEFDLVLLQAIPSRLFGIMTNEILITVPFFIFMGIMLERTGIARKLISTFADVFHFIPNSVPITVVLLGALLAASTGIVGATIITMGLLALPIMIDREYSHSVACGTICAAGTLGVMIPPSILLVLVGDIIGTENQRVQLELGNFAPDNVTIADFFAGAMIPGLLLVGLYIVYLLLHGIFTKHKPKPPPVALGHDVPFLEKIKILVPPIVLIVAVLGSILAGAATPTEAAALGAFGALSMAILYRSLTFEVLIEVMRNTMAVNAMIYTVVLGASVFSLVFRGYGGDEMIEALLLDIPGGALATLIVTMLAIFLIGFIVEVIEIIYVVVPIVTPALLKLGYDPLWLGVLITVNLQTSFLTPPMGYALFYLRGVAPRTVRTESIYRGVGPFIALQVLSLVLLTVFPELVLWLPRWLTGGIR